MDERTCIRGSSLTMLPSMLSDRFLYTSDSSSPKALNALQKASKEKVKDKLKGGEYELESYPNLKK